MKQILAVFGYFYKGCKNVEFEEKILDLFNFCGYMTPNLTTNMIFENLTAILKSGRKNWIKILKNKKINTPPFTWGKGGGIVLKQHLCHISFRMRTHVYLNTEQSTTLHSPQVHFEWVPTLNYPLRFGTKVTKSVFEVSSNNERGWLSTLNWSETMCARV